MNSDLTYDCCIAVTLSHAVIQNSNTESMQVPDNKEFLAIPRSIMWPLDIPIYVADDEWTHTVARDSKFNLVVDCPAWPDLVDFRSTSLFRSFKSALVEGADWSTTPFFMENAKRISAGARLWGCSTEADLLKRLNIDVRLLYASMLQNGYFTQNNIIEIGIKNNNALASHFRNYYEAASNNHEIKIGFDATGRAIFVDGRHRLAIALLLGLKELPVDVVFRDAQWIAFHDNLKNIASKLSNHVLYHKLPHPDLTYIPYAHGDQRLSIIERAIKRMNLPESARCLDIGANMGNLSLFLAKSGFRPVAIENNYAYCETMRNLSHSLGLPVEVVHQSLETFDPAGFDAVFALNIFHHLINESKTFNELEKFVSQIDAKWLVFQPHNKYGGDVGFGKYRDFSPDGFAEFIAERAGFTSIEHLPGEGSDRRTIYLLGRK